MDVRKIRRYQYCSAWNDKNKPVITTTASLNEARSNYKYAYRGQDAGEVDGWTHELVDDMPDKFVKRSNRDWAFSIDFLISKMWRVSKLLYYVIQVLLIYLVLLKRNICCEI